MKDFSAEKRLELVRQIRDTYHQNEYDLRNREQILYGKTLSERPAQEPEAEENAQSNTESTFGIRMLLAGMLLLTVILLDKSNKSVAGVSTEQIFRAIGSDYEQTITSLSSELVTVEKE